MSWLLRVLGLKSMDVRVQKNLDLIEPQVYPLSLEKTITTTEALALENAADMLLGTTLILTINGIQTVYRLTSGTDASSPPRVIRPADYATKHRVWRMTPVQGWAEVLDNNDTPTGVAYPIYVKMQNGLPQPYIPNNPI